MATYMEDTLDIQVEDNETSTLSSTDNDDIEDDDNVSDVGINGSEEDEVSDTEPVKKKAFLEPPVGVRLLDEIKPDGYHSLLRRRQDRGTVTFSRDDHWMETLYGWAPASMKPKSLGAYVHSSGFQGLSNIGMVVRDLHTGNIIQLESQATGGLLRVNGISGKIDFGGIFGKQSQFIVQRYLGDVVTLRCVANPKNFLVLRNGTLYANGKGDPLCRFCFHLCDGQYMKFESVHNANRYMSVHRKYGGDDDVRSLRTKSAMSSGERGTQGLFKVVLVGHMNQSFAT